MNCEWREKTGLYVDGELEPAAQQAFAGHLQACSDCSAAVLEQQELKKAVRLAGKRFSAPPELYANVRKQMRPRAGAGMWWKLGSVAAGLVIIAALGISWFSRSSGRNATIAQLVDQHVAMTATNNLDVVSGNQHTVKPWYQGKVPFTFNVPNLAADSPFKLIGGKLVYVEQKPGAELVYQAGLHKISVFIFQAGDHASRQPAWNHDSSFSVSSWTAGGRQCYLVTDASQDEAGQLVTLFQEANRS
jgi:anti-sigma factor RsiW